MADKLHLLLGQRKKKYGLTFAKLLGVNIVLPVGTNSFNPSPPVNTWTEVVNVTGSGRLRGVALLSTYVYAGFDIGLRVTIDGVVASTTATIAGTVSTYTYIVNADGLIGTNFVLLPEHPFESSLKIEVWRNSTSASMNLYEHHEMEV